MPHPPPLSRHSSHSKCLTISSAVSPQRLSGLRAQEQRAAQERAQQQHQQQLQQQQQQQLQLILQMPDQSMHLQALLLLQQQQQQQQQQQKEQQRLEQEMAQQLQRRDATQMYVNLFQSERKANDFGASLNGIGPALLQELQVSPSLPCSDKRQ
jgi:hypothetical protein